MDGSEDCVIVWVSLALILFLIDICVHCRDRFVPLKIGLFVVLTLIERNFLKWITTQRLEDHCS